MRMGVQSMKRSAQSPALKNELAPLRGFSKLVAQVEDFPTGDERRQRAQIGQHPCHFGRVSILGLL